MKHLTVGQMRALLDVVKYYRQVRPPQDVSPQLATAEQKLEEGIEIKRNPSPRKEVHV